MQSEERLEVFTSQGKILHLAPLFCTCRGINTPINLDLLLTNNKVIHDIHIKAGPLTTTDRIPVMIKISVKKTVEATTDSAYRESRLENNKKKGKPGIVKEKDIPKHE